MGRNTKAIAAFGIMMFGVPEHAKVILTALVDLVVSNLPTWLTPSLMVYMAIVFFVVKLPVAFGVSRVIWKVRNAPDGGFLKEALASAEEPVSAVKDAAVAEA